MKRIFKTPLIWASFVVLAVFSFSCKPMPVEPEENRFPGQFTVTPTPDLNSAVLNWTAAVDPDGDVVRYTVELEGAEIERGLDVTTYELKNLEFETSYSGRVIASDPEGYSTPSPFTFTTGMSPNEAPEDFKLQAPINGAIFQETNISLSWQDAVDPEGGNITYDLYLDQSAIPSTLFQGELGNTSLQVNDLENETTYYWKVIAKDDMGASTESDVFSFTTKTTVVATLVGNAPWAERAGHTTLVFDNKMWVLGGNSCCGGRFNDVWSSPDGVNWTEVTSAAPWAARTVHTSVVHDGKMWVVAGNSSYTQGSEFADIWYSSDGANWILASEMQAFEPRYGHEMVVYDGKMWIFGGRDVNQSFSRQQVWNSTDGIGWNLLTDSLALFPSSTGEMIVHDNKMWYIGGYSDNVSWSTDGLNWTQVTSDAPFGQRLQHECVSFDNRMWLFSGSNSTNQLQELPDVWYSVDGETWIEAASNAGYVAVAQHQVLAFNGKIWMLGGGGGFQSFYVSNEVYSFE
ncbi:MAG: fibronectin type III domain-containing protein [Bacteroidota bacterium]